MYSNASCSIFSENNTLLYSDSFCFLMDVGPITEYKSSKTRFCVQKIRNGRRRIGCGRLCLKHEWIPLTKLSRLVKDGKIRSCEEIYLFSQPIRDCEVKVKLFQSFLEGEYLSVMNVQSQSNNGKEMPCKLVLEINNNVKLEIKCSLEVANSIQGAIMLAKLAIVPVCVGILRNKAETPRTPVCKFMQKGKSTFSKLVSATNGNLNLSNYLKKY